MKKKLKPFHLVMLKAIAEVCPEHMLQLMADLMNPANQSPSWQHLGRVGVDDHPSVLLLRGFHWTNGRNWGTVLDRVNNGLSKERWEQIKKENDYDNL